ncbi:hypothetical protein SAMN05444354_107291 [Stigmatella aurantiaca]|uniref:Uncharacterized protein n=1 Tax=Stigmatella aurantiaca TaxID=41 RepID=A0A1H7S2M9_STIAU|nr:hypothetical protein SAMN05444354_107291 [Stigmatella aurantiaca]
MNRPGRILPHRLKQGFSLQGPRGERIPPQA